MLTILTLVGLAFGGGVCLMCREVRRAPVGYQDETGFHAAPVEVSPVPVEAVHHAEAA